MNSALRLTLVTMTVGGGSAGAAITAQIMFSPQAETPAARGICMVFALLYLFVLTSGLWFVQNPRKLVPMATSLVLQIPVFSSPIVAYRFGAGVFAPAGVTVE